MTRMDWDRAKRRATPTSKGPTAAQLDLLAKFGVTKPPATRSEASTLIGRLLAEEKRRK